MRLDHLLSKEKVRLVEKLNLVTKENEKDERPSHVTLFNFQCPKALERYTGNCIELHGGVAQLGEHLPCKQGVKGSNPFISTTPNIHIGS